jgi:hypothetical protein
MKPETSEVPAQTERAGEVQGKNDRWEFLRIAFDVFVVEHARSIVTMSV